MVEAVLLVEDSRAMRAFVSSILESSGGWEVHEVDNGFEALRVLPRGSFGLIVTDVNMPDINGIELTRFVRRMPSHARTPVIVISTDGAEEDGRRAIAAGASAFLAKPFTAEQLLSTIDRVQRAAQRGEGES